MAAPSLDVEGQIENLRGFRSDLEELFWSLDDRSGATAYALGVVLTQLAHRMTALEDTVRRLGSESVLLPELEPEETRSLDRTLAFLDGELGATAAEPAKLWPRVRRLLAAADELLMVIARGSAAPAEAGDAAPRAVVLPFARSRG